MTIIVASGVVGVLVALGVVGVLVALGVVGVLVANVWHQKLVWTEVWNGVGKPSGNAIGILQRFSYGHKGQNSYTFQTNHPD